MRGSHAYSHADVTAILRLAGEVGELPPDVHARRTHVLNRLLALVGGIHAQCSEIELANPHRYGLAVPDRTTQVGVLPDRELKFMARYLSTNEPAADPCVRYLLRARGNAVTLRREDVMDRSWYRSAHYNEFRRAIRAGESLYNRFRAPDGRAFRMGILRELNDRPFAERDVRLLRLFHENLAGLYCVASPAAPPPPPPAAEVPDDSHRDVPRIEDLPPRLQPVLRMMLQGDAEKQIARKLGLSPHTVHEYAKVLYRTLAVSSRGELLARFVTW
jgi:DNA-binding CsgD family transcriptional regulator